MMCYIKVLIVSHWFTLSTNIVQFNFKVLCATKMISLSFFILDFNLEEVI